jgi:peptidoglycan/LPS O-acetylase OafA/YrhL
MVIAREASEVRKAEPRNRVRFVALDFYRFIAASGVVLSHFSDFSGRPERSWLPESTREFYLFVDFFFILSGFVIAYTYSDADLSIRNTLNYLRRRLARIYPLYLLTLMFFVGSSSMGFSHYPDRANAASTISQLTLMNSWSLNARLPFNLPAWSISVEWAMYLLFPLMLFVSRLVGAWILLPIIVLGFYANEKYIASGLLVAPLWFIDISPIRALPSFATGMLIAASFSRFGSPYGIWTGLCAFLLSIMMMVLQANVYVVIGMFSISILLTAGGEFSGRSNLFDNSICKALGDASYSVYMLHVIVIMVAIDFSWKRHTGTIEFPIFLFLFVIFPMIVGCSVVTFRVFEKPMRDIISGRRKLSKGSEHQLSFAPMWKRLRGRA